MIRTPTRSEGGITETEKIKMEEISEKWIKISLLTKSTSSIPVTERHEIIRREVENLYAAANLKKPRVVIVPSPLVAALSYGIAAAWWYLRGIRDQHIATRTATDIATFDAISRATARATDDATDSATRTATRIATDSATYDATDSATASATDSATRRATDDATARATARATRTATASATRTATRIATSSATYDATDSATDSATYSATDSATRRATYDATASATDTATDIATRTATDIATARATDTATARATRIVTDSATYDATDSATASATRTATRIATDSATRTATRIATDSATYDYLWLKDLAKHFLGNDYTLGIRCISEWSKVYHGGNMWAAFPSWAESCRDVLGLTGLDVWSSYKCWETLATVSGFRILHEKFCIVCDFPEVFNTLKNGETYQLHKDGGPALKWADGFSVWSLHGITVPQWLAETEAEKIDPKLILTEKNTDVQREAIRKYGYDRMLKACNAQIIEVWQCPKTGLEYTMRHMKIGEIDRRYLCYEHASMPGIFYAKCVPPEAENCIQMRGFQTGIVTREDLRNKKMSDENILKELPETVQ